MTTYPGRGCWSSIGRDSGRTTYRYLAGTPLDGQIRPDGTFADLNHEAINYGVQALQKRINALGYTPALAVDGTYGPASDRGARWVQHLLGLVVDGDIGPRTCRALWHPQVGAYEAGQNLPRHILWGIVVHESLLDPGAVGASTPGDKGLCQYNTLVGGMTIAQAFDPVWALSHAAVRLHSALQTYAGRGATLQVECAVASWNSPVWAQQWFDAAAAPNDKIAAYVNNVLTQAATF